MELIVKIGADQANLQQTVGRMKAQFASQNISMPMGWTGPGGSSAGAAWQNAARAGNPDGESMSDQYGMTGKGMGKLLGATGLKYGAMYVIASKLKELWEYATAKFSEGFWNNTYGIGDKWNARIQATHDALRKGVQSVLGLREKEKDQQEKDVLEGASPEAREAMLKRLRAESAAKVKTAQSDYAFAQRTAIESTGLGGAPLSGPQRMQLAGEVAKAEEALIRARMKAAEYDKAYSKQIDENVRAAVKDRDKTPAPAKEEKPLSFQADAMAQAGLFAGSSLVFNPSFTVAQQQLDVLREIAGNTTDLKGGIFQ